MLETAEQLQALCEAILAVAGEPVTVEAIAAAAGDGVASEAVIAALAELRGRYERPGCGMMLEQVAGGWRLAARPELEGVLRSFAGARLSQAALETLAIVAYRQPVTLPEINFLRGVASAGVVRTLLERKLIRVAGRKQVVGTPFLYRTTREFLVHFGLDDLSGLPPLSEPERVAEEGSSGI
jgi:segregation and condensation protein B